jgi:TolA-binding protein
MKRTERHKLKENEFARTVAQAQEVFEARKRDLAMGALIAVVLVAVIGGFFLWQRSRAAHANGALAAALAVYEAPVIPPQPPAPGSPAPVPQPGTFQTERDKLEASLPKFQEAADKYPNTTAGVAARFHMASILASLGRHAEAEQRYNEVVQKAGSNIYGRTARLGLAEVQVAQGKYDPAIQIYTELSRDTNAQMPVDGVLMQLGRTYARAGKKEDAVRAFNRVVEEFPESLYAADAKKELEEIKKS